MKEWFTKGLLSEKYFKKVPHNDTQKWLNVFGKNIIDSVNTTLVEYVGKPLVKLLRFLKHEHRWHCVPSNISSGLTSLPLEYIYINGSQTRERTTQKLPFGEKLNGNKSYERILYFFTTSEDLTPEKIHELGKQNLRILYAEAIKAAENETEKLDIEAVDGFKKILNDQSSFFNDAPFPANESNEFAFAKCTNLTQAKIFCPKRNEAFQKWSAFVRGMTQFLRKKEQCLILML